MDSLSTIRQCACSVILLVPLLSELNGQTLTSCFAFCRRHCTFYMCQIVSWLYHESLTLTIQVSCVVCLGFVCLFARDISGLIIRFRLILNHWISVTCFIFTILVLIQIKKIILYAYSSILQKKKNIFFGLYLAKHHFCFCFLINFGALHKVT